MDLWLVENMHSEGYGVFQRAVVAAESEEAALHELRYKCRPRDRLTARVVGTAAPGEMAGVLCCDTSSE